ncbi:MAG: hypothetical protein IJO11_02015, partial [Alphaproteobacteria bacterium]|nr:hypothetical protein [Alphaproteobacteria bacterium]
ADKCVNCDSRKGLILSSGKCVCPAGKVMRLDETTGEYRCQCPENTPEEADEETCECPSGYDNIDENGDGINECVIVCPEGSGLTGVRNAQGNCLCDVDSGYIEVATKLADGGYLCSCDETNDYYTGPEGCIKCVQTTKEWCNKRTPAGSSNTNCDTIDETKWWCGFRKSLGATGFLVYNPSTKDYCELYEVLSKTALGFECTKCDDYTLYKGSRTTNTGICLCAVGEHLEGDMCIAECVSGNYYEGTGQCISCAKSSVYSNDGICHSTDICRDTENGVYWWYTWISKTKGNCSQSFPNYTTDMSDPCSYVYGCVVNTTTLPYCEINTIITTECRCASGDTNGYCCSVSSYPTASGCVSCTDGTVPNANRTGCEKCPNNMIAKNGVCTRCDEGYYPNSTQVRCLACPPGTTTDAEGLACTVCVDAEKVFDNTTGTCLDPCTQTADCSESTDGMCCDTERKVCRKCIPDDCNTNKGFEYADGKCICSAQAPVLQNGECVSCSSVDETKPYWDGVECVATCPTERPYLDGGVCVGTCPSDKSVGTDNVCIDVTTWCTQQMQNAGYSTSRFTVSGITITYKSDMTVSTALDISKCNLTVQGKLTVNSGKSLNALVVSATSSSSQGVNNTGTITVTELTGISTTSQYGINNTGTITVSNGTIIGESATSHGIYNTGTSAQITAKTITGKNSATSKSYYGLYVDSGTVKATSSITGTGGSGIYNNETMTGITITGTGTAGYGVYNKAGIITATGTITGYGTSDDGISLDDGTITAVSVNGTSEERYGITVDTSLIATGNVTGKTNATKNYAGIYMYTSSSYLKAKNVLGIATGGGTEFGYGITGIGTIEASETIIGKGADTGISGPTLKAQQITGEATKGDGIGLAATVTATGNVVGDGGPKGTGIFSGTITTTGDVIGKSVVKIGVQAGKINAKNIIGTSVDSIGVEIVGTNMPVTVTENITGISETGYGVYLSYTNISAKNIYYCKKYYKSNASNSVKCASGCTCTN